MVKELQDGSAGISSIYTVKNILDALLNSDKALSLSEISKVCELPLPRLHPYLHELNQAGLITRNPITLDYSLGSLCVLLGINALGKNIIVKSLRSALSQFASRHNVNVLLSVLGPRGVVVLENYEYASTMNAAFSVGTNLSFFSTAAGILHWSFLSEQSKNKYLELKNIADESMAHFLLQKPEQEDIFQAAKRKGWCFIQEQPIHHLEMLAYPFFDAAGNIAATVTITMPLGSLKETEAADWLHELKEEING